jgi:hypothetical protein
MMIFRSTTTATLVVLLATTAANFASTANAQTSQGLCPLVSPVTTLDVREGGTCNSMNEECRYVPATGAPVCPIGTDFRCRCASGGSPYICSCRGDGKDAGEDATDVEALDVGLDEAASGANMVSTLMVSGAAIATLALGL